ncbi:MAG TPA: biotin/lipoyl-containing protein, partial [Candidatus Dormibacteraeota bacterium]
MPQSTMQVTLPEMGESVTEGTVAKWLKQPGDPVREGEALVEVTTDKVDAEVPAPATGTLTKILAEAGKTIAVGAPLAEIAVGADGESAAKKTPTIPTAANGEEKKAPTAPSPVGGGEKKAASVEVEVTEGAELLAKAKGIDLATIKGSGPGGSIRRRDVAEAIERQAPTLPSPASGGGKEAGLPAPAETAPTRPS